MSEALSVEEQAVIQSTMIRSTLKALAAADQAGDLEAVRKLGNALNMQQKEMTNIQRVLFHQSKGGKRRTVTELTGTTATSENDVAAGDSSA